MADNVYDISMALSEDMPIYPGDPEFSRTLAKSLAQGDSCDVSDIRFGTHAGTHLDFPSHFVKGGATLETYPPERFMLDAIVVSVDNTDYVMAGDIESLPDLSGKAVLLKTANSTLQPAALIDSTVSRVTLNPQAAQQCVEKGAALVGIDALSVESGDPTHAVHHILLKNDVLILEGLRLASVPEGDYKLFCFPLLITGSEASPTRAILVRESC